MSSDDDNDNDYYIDAIGRQTPLPPGYIDALGRLTPLPPGSTGTPGPDVPTTPAPQPSQQRANPSTAQTDFATSAYRRQAPRARRNLSGVLNRDDNLLTLDARGRVVDSRGQLVPIVGNSSRAVTAPPKRQQVETLEDLIQRDHRAVVNYLVKPSFYVARGAVKHVVVPAAKMAGKLYVEAVKANKTHMRFDPALTGNTVPSARAVTPLVRALARTASGVLASASERSWSNNLGDASSPAKVIPATKQTGDDMPPTRTSSMRPEVAKRELEQIIRSSSEPEPVKARLITEIDEAMAKFTRRGVDPERLVTHMRRQLSSAVSAPDSPGASTPIKQVAQHSLLAPTTSAPTPRSSTPPPASPEPATSQSNVVRSTQRNGHSLVTVDSNASFQSTVSHGLQTLRESSYRGLDGPDRTISAPVRPGDFQQPVAPEPARDGPDRTISAPVRPGDFQQPVAPELARDGPDRTISAPVRPGDFQQPVAPAQSSAVVRKQEVEATLEDTQTAAAAATVQNTQVSAVAGMNAVAAAARDAQGASPETLVSLLEELQRNPQLRQLASAGLLSWNDLLSDRHETLPDGTKVRVVDAKKLLALQQRLSTLAQKEAGKLQNIQQVAVQNRTVPGLKQATPGAIYPGVSVFMYPREMPAGRPGA